MRVWEIKERPVTTGIEGGRVLPATTVVGGSEERRGLDKK
jgi:hypothetical protein